MSTHTPISSTPTAAPAPHALTPSSPRPEVRAKFFFVGEEKFRVRGVTYGPFRPQPGTPDVFLPPLEKVRSDLKLIRELGANVLRIYHPPPRWFLDELAAEGLRAMVTVPWPQHIAFLDSRKTREDIRSRIRAAAEACKAHPALFALLVGNEIPSDLVRWYGEKRVRMFIDELVQVAKKVDPGALVSFAAYPPTEYLLPRFVDFLTFNVYLHKRQDFSNYIARLQNLAEEKPLMLGEFGMDTLRHSEEEQAEMLSWHIEAGCLGGLAGTVLFAFTDEWFTGGHDITDWAFGLVTRDRQPKKAFHTVRQLWTQHGGRPAIPGGFPKVSVVVCSYNGGKTLLGALESLDRVDYPDFEVLLVDDGSKDNSQELVRRFEKERVEQAQKENRKLPPFRNIVQTNFGLSVARNQGIYAAQGEIVAFTDSDCVADKDWLYYLVAVLKGGDFGAVGGPNISPPAHDWIQACVAAAPGSPSHVLMTDTVAEHVPGCNMAYWRWALLEIEGFDAEYRKAGDDVDVCWRLMQRGYQIGFSPSAVVWHHRRFTVGAYFGQQRGYGEAESLLRFKHLNYFGPTGGAKWRGAVYGTPRFETFFGGPIIYHGSLGTGLFQCIYPRRESEWAGLASSLEWVGLTLFIFLISIQLPGLRLLPLVMMGLTLCVGVSWMARARVEPKHDSVLGRLLLLYLAIAQPLARSWARYTTWITHKRTPARSMRTVDRSKSLVWSPGSVQVFWNEQGKGRQELIGELARICEHDDWRYSLDAGWESWDIELFGNRWWRLCLQTVNEYHGGPKVLVRVKHNLSLSTFSVIFFSSAFLLILVGILAFGSKLISALAASAAAIVFLLYRGLRLKNLVAHMTDAAARHCGMTPVSPDKDASRK